MSVSWKVVRTMMSGAASTAASMLARLLEGSVDSKVSAVPPRRSAAAWVPVSPIWRNSFSPMGFGVM